MIHAGGEHWLRGLALGLVICHAILMATVVCAQDVGLRVKSVEVRGNKHIELDAIQGRLTLKPNDPYRADTLRAQIKTLYETGFFEDVQVETDPTADGVAVVFLVREKPFITEIVFDGNDSLSDDKLKEKLTIKSQSFLDQQQAKESADKIRLAYQEDGYYKVEVIPVIQTTESIHASQSP